MDIDFSSTSPTETAGNWLCIFGSEGQDAKYLEIDHGMPFPLLLCNC